MAVLGDFEIEDVENLESEDEEKKGGGMTENQKQLTQIESRENTKRRPTLRT